MIKYEKLWNRLADKHISQYYLIKHHNISPSQLTRLKHNEGVTTHTLNIFCEILDCSLDEIAEYSYEEIVSEGEGADGTVFIDDADPIHVPMMDCEISASPDLTNRREHERAERREDYGLNSERGKPGRSDCRKPGQTDCGKPGQTNRREPEQTDRREPGQTDCGTMAENRHPVRKPRLAVAAPNAHSQKHIMK